MAITRNLTVYIGNRLNREALKEGSSPNNAEVVEAVEIDEYLPIGYIDSIKFTVIIAKTRVFFTTSDIQSIFNIDLSKKAVAINEYDEELVTPMILRRALIDISTDTKIKDFEYMESVANNLLKLIR